MEPTKPDEPFKSYVHSKTTTLQGNYQKFGPEGKVAGLTLLDLLPPGISYPGHGDSTDRTTSALGKFKITIEVEPTSCFCGIDGVSGQVLHMTGCIMEPPPT